LASPLPPEEKIMPYRVRMEGTITAMVGRKMVSICFQYRRHSTMNIKTQPAKAITQPARVRVELSPALMSTLARKHSTFCFFVLAFKNR